MSILPLFVVIPLAAAFLISLLGKRVRYVSDLLAGVATLMLSFLSVNSIFLVKKLTTVVYKVGGWMPPVGICLVLDGLSSLMLVTVNVITFLVAVYSVSYMERYTDKWKFYTLFMLMLAGMNGIIITGDVFNLFVFLEIASIASYALVAFGAESEELEASFKYAVMGSVASSFILLGIALLYSYTSTLNMADMSLILLQKGPSKIVPFVSVLFLMGFGLKAALVPFHAWLPDAHPSAPAPISAMLSGLIIKVLGIYALFRILFNVLGMPYLISVSLMSLGIISMVVGAFLAIGQDDMKRMLAYSSISQIGYIILALAIGTPLAIIGGLFHLINHAIFKSLLFLNAGAVEYSTGTRSLAKMGGLDTKLPVVSSTNLIGSMSISGIPPLSGFWSKLIIIVACIQAKYFFAAFMCALVSIVTLAYYLKLYNSAFLGKLKEGFGNIKNVPILMRFSLVVLAILSVIGGLLVVPQLRDFLQSAADVLLAGRDYLNSVFGAI